MKHNLNASKKSLWVKKNIIGFIVLIKGLFIVFYCLDCMLQHIWKNKTMFSITENDYFEFIHSFQNSPRPFSSKFNVQQHLLKLSFKLKINIMVIGFKSGTKTFHFVQCPSKKKHSSLCKIPYYFFQNIFYNLLSKEKKNTLIFFIHKSDVYAAGDNVPHLTPVLINTKSEKLLSIGTTQLTTKNIDDILKSKNNEINFSVYIFSSFQFVSTKSIQTIKKNCLGIYNGNETDIYLFLTPQFLNGSFTITRLYCMDKFKHEFDKKNIFSFNHTTEGINSKNDLKQQHNEEHLDQDYCICQHPSTQFIPSFNSEKFSSLADKYMQKFFLHENLGHCSFTGLLLHFVVFLF